jgi:predicted nucleic acid-binding protein
VKILVDTSVWSTVLRRRKKTGNEQLLSVFKDLIKDFRVTIIGPVRQEILSGIQDNKQFTALKKHLDAFEDIPITTQDYIRAAEFYNLCRKNGIQGSHTDFLIHLN